MAPHINPKVLPGDKEGRQEFLSFLNRQIKEHPVVKEHHGKWKELIEWTDEGNQYSEWDAASNSVRSVPLNKRKRRCVVNLMKPLAEALESKVNTIYKVAGSPNSSELEDAESSVVATKLLAHNDYSNGVESLWEDFKYDLIRTGNAFLKVVFDKGMHGFTRNLEGKKKRAEGDVLMSVPSVFNIRTDPTGKCYEEWKWCMELAEMNDDDIIEAFDIDREELGGSLGEGSKYNGMNEEEAEKDKTVDTHVVILCWQKESKEYPQGRHIISTENVFLYAETNPGCFPEEKMSLPLFHQGYHRKGNSMWHRSPMHHVQPIQRDFNRFVSIISEHIEGWRPKLIVDYGSIKKGAYTHEPFEILERSPGSGPVTPVNIPALGGDIFAHRDFLRSMIPEVSNVHEVSYSRLPQYASRAPASLYSMMLEQENAKLDPLIVKWNRLILKMSKYRLLLMQKYYKQERMVRIVGKNNEISIDWFSGSELKDNCDVRLEIGISIHQSKTIMQRMLLELKDSGIITDNSKIIKLLMLGDIESDLRGDIADETRALRENQAFINDTAKKPFEKGGVLVWIHDDHDVHLDHHTNLWKTAEVQRWPAKQKDPLDEHIMHHHILQMQLQQAGAGAQGPQTGAPAPGGWPGTPADIDRGGGAPGPAPQPQTPTLETQQQGSANTF